MATAIIRLCCLLLCFLPALLPASTNHHVILITIDGFPANVLADEKAPIPTIKRLAAEGAMAEGMRVSNPSVTWPNHTTLVTGVRPEKHSVFFNGVLVRPGPGLPVRVDPRRDKSDLVAVPTVYDFLHRAGYRTAEINWPCTRGATTLDDSFPDVPEQVVHMTRRLRDELVETRVLESTNQAAFGGQSSAVKDQIWTAAALHVLERRRPHFMLWHMLVTDSIHHKYGPQSPASYVALAQVDSQVAELLRLLERTGIRERTTIFITSDHGFETALKLVLPNVVFRKGGLLELDASGRSIARAQAQIISEGGIAMVYLTDPQTLAADRGKVMSLLRDHEGVAEILGPDQFPALGLPDPAQNRQMADLILVAKPGYAFNNDASNSSSMAEVTLTTGSQGHHGYLSTNPKMNAAFVAWGRGIRRGARPGIIENINVAPTIAALFGKNFPSADGKPLRKILADASP